MGAKPTSFPIGLEVAGVAGKELAMRKFVSQESKYGHERWMESLRASAAGDSWSYGGEHGFAELFQISRFVG